LYSRRVSYSRPGGSTYSYRRPKIAGSGECHYILCNSKTRNGAIPAGLRILSKNEMMGLFHYCYDWWMPIQTDHRRGEDGGDGNYIPGTHGRVKRDLIRAVELVPQAGDRAAVQAGYYSTSNKLACGPSLRLQTLTQNQAAKTVTVTWATLQRCNSTRIFFHFALCLTTARAPSQSNSLPLSCVGLGYRWTRGDGSPCSQLSRSAPLSVVSNFGGRQRGGCLTMPFTHLSLFL